MLDRQAALGEAAALGEGAAPAAGSDVVAAVRDIASRTLAPIVQKIDTEGFYPESVLRAFGRAGAPAVGRHRSRQG